MIKTKTYTNSRKKRGRKTKRVRAPKLFESPNIKGAIHSSYTYSAYQPSSGPSVTSAFPLPHATPTADFQYGNSLKTAPTLANSLTHTMKRKRPTKPPTWLQNWHVINDHSKLSSHALKCQSLLHIHFLC